MIDPFEDGITGEEEKPVPVEKPTGPGILVKRYMIEIQVYPNGPEYQRIYPIGQEKRQGKKKTVKKDMTVPKIVQTEEV